MIAQLLTSTLDMESKTIVLTEDHLSKKMIFELEFDSIKPSDVKYKHFHAIVRATLSENSLLRTKAKVVFRYKGKDYLLIYNK